MKIYVGNLSFQTTEASLRELFSQHGEVQEAAIVTDRETGRSRGFGFVTMPDNSAAENAISALNGTQHDGRSLTVNEARPKPQGGGGRRDFGRSSGGGGGGGGGRSRGGW
jgi:RNA recognition motif-containing protein